MDSQTPISANTAQPTLEMAEKLVWDTVRHVEQLTELAAKFPDQFRAVARRLPAWPVMRFKREAMGDHFLRILYRLELAEDYPLDTSSNARSHVTSATGKYLTHLVERIHRFKLTSTGLPNETVRASHLVGVCDGQLPDDGQLRSEIASILELVMCMPTLTKATSDEWSRRVLVPLIMLTDAGSDESACKQSALQAIWRQSGVKSRATFRSRLLTKVRQTLRSLAKR